MKQLINHLRRKLFPAAPLPYLDAPAGEGYLLWPATADAPVEKVQASGAERIVTSVHRPSIVYYPAAADKATGTAVIIAPGGSHKELWVDHEGHLPARWLSERGVASFVLKYRLGKQEGSPYTVEEHALADILRAMRMVRSQSQEWGIRRIGVMGFSAGGELAALAAMRYEQPPGLIHDAIDRQPSRPDFQVLVYPSKPARYVVTKQSPPAFITGGYDDHPSIIDESANLFVRFRQQGVRAELHLYAHAGHGYGFREANKGGLASWPQRLYEWMGDEGLLG